MRRVSDARCLLPPMLASASFLELFCCLPEVERSFGRSSPTVVEGGDTDQNVTVQASRTTVEADFLSRAVLVADRFFFAFLFFPTQPRPARTSRRRS